MREIASIELHIIAKELEDRINNSYIKKFYDLGSGMFKLVLHREEKLILYIDLLKTVNLTQTSEQAEQATNFAMAMRKRIENAKVTAVEQHKSDRILVLTIKSDKEYRLIIEMFGKGNMILTDSDYGIELCYRIIDYRERRVRPRAAYVFPKGESLEFGKVSKSVVDALLESAAEGDAGIISFLIRHLNIGPLYLEEIIRGCGMEPKKALKGADAAGLSGAILGFFSQIAHPQFTIYSDDKGSVDYAVIPIGKYEKLQKQGYGSLSELLDSLYMEKRLGIKDEKRDGALKEITINIGKQRELARSLAGKAEEYRGSANRIFEHMQEINELVSYMRQNRRADREELQKRFGGLTIREVDLKNKMVKIDIG